MALTSEDDDKIERYAAGLMNPDEVKIFLSEVESSEELQDALDLELALRDNFEYIDMPVEPEAGNETVSLFDDPVYLKSLVDRVSKERQEENNRNIKSESGASRVVPMAQHETSAISINFWSTIAVAATLILTISLFIIEFSDSTNTQIANKPTDTVQVKVDSSQRINNDSLRIIMPTEIRVDYAKLYKSFYRKDKVPAELPQVIESELLAYEEGKYRDLQDFDLENLPTSRGDENPSNNPKYIRELGYYYKGIAFIESQNELKAVTNFNWVLKNSTNKIITGKASWYLALLKIKQGTKADAIKLLQDVLANNSVREYHKNAEKLLTELE